MRRTTTRLWLPAAVTAALLAACTPDDDATTSPADPADAGRSVEEEIAANHDWVDSDLTWDEASATRITLDGDGVRTDGFKEARWLRWRPVSVPLLRSASTVPSNTTSPPAAPAPGPRSTT